MQNRLHKHKRVSYFVHDVKDVSFYLSYYDQ